MNRNRLMAAAGSTALAISAMAVALPTHAANTPATCGTLTAVLAAASSGDVITLQNPTGLCTGTYTLPNTNITLQGGTGTQGFDGIGQGHIVSTLAGNNVGATIIQNLTFQNGHSNTNGGAISITGTSAPQILNSKFLGNSATFNGGAVLIQTSGNGGATIANDVFGSLFAGGNSAAGFGGGALLISLSGPLSMINNQFLANSVTGGSQSVGGGAHLAEFGAPDKNVTISDNRFEGNVSSGDGGGLNFQGDHTLLMVARNSFKGNHLNGNVGNSPFSPANVGGGAYIENAVLNGSNGRTTQTGNRFDSNVIDALTTSSQDFGGGGEWLQAGNTSSTNDVFVNNSVGNGSAGRTPVGGGLGLRGLNNTTLKGVLTAANLVATGNSVGTTGQGGGLYAGGEGCSDPVTCPATINLFDSTVAGNSVGAGGIGAGMAGDSGDIATLANDIVNLNTGAPNQVDGFGTLAISFSDVCRGTAAEPGTGNICVDPKLKNVAGGDVHETAVSPTLNVGSNAAIPAGLTIDFEGDPRIAQNIVDMGADEFEPTVPALPAAGHPSS